MTERQFPLATPAVCIGLKKINMSMTMVSSAIVTEARNVTYIIAGFA